MKCGLAFFFLSAVALATDEQPRLGAAAPQAGPARHYSYSGSDPALWTSSALSAGEAAAAKDFTVFPCNAANCEVAQVVTDASRNTYVAGSRYFPVQSPTATAQASDAFVAKLDPAGATLFLASFSGKGNEAGTAIAVDSAGNIFLGGYTTSPNFPLRNAIQPERGTDTTGFLVKLNPDGRQLIYSTYFGGTSGSASVSGIAADSAGNLYVTGQTGSRDFPASPGMPAGTITGWGPGGTLGAFVAKLSPTGDRVLYSGRISGGALACSGGSSCFLSIRSISGVAIAVDSAGNAYIAGNANVRDLPTTPGALVEQGLGGWVARVNASGTKLDYLTYLGASTYGSGTYVSAANWTSGLAVDAEGNAYVVGWTSDPKFRTTAGALQPTYNGPANPPTIGSPPPSDAFVAKLNPRGTAMIYATFLGGSGADVATAVAVESAGAAYVMGTTDSSDFPVTAGPSRGRKFLAVLNPAASALSFSTRYPDGSVSPTIAVDLGDRVRIAGPGGMVSSFSLNTALSTRLFGIASAAGGVIGPAVAPGEVVSLFGTRLGPARAAVAEAASNGKMPTMLAGTQVLFDGIPAPLLYVSEDQVNAVAPFGLSPPKNTTVRVVAGSETSPDMQGVGVPSRPTVFSRFGAAAAINEDGTANAASNPAKLGSVVSIWVTGVGRVFPSPEDGQVATAAQENHCCGVYLSERSAEVLYSGAAPGMVAGVVQINFRVPPDHPYRTGSVRVTAPASPANLPAPPPPDPSIFVAP
jgi:uncharacterized protein (TIGR03437 family)